MSLILRHKPETIGISLDEHGWANVHKLIAGIAKTHDFNMDMYFICPKMEYGSRKRFRVNIKKKRKRTYYEYTNLWD